jgi:hypothetical protein
MNTKTLDDYIDALRARRKPMRKFIQLDGWANQHEYTDDLMRSDDEGDTCTAGPVWEPQRSATTVRVLIAADADPADAVRVLRKLLAWAEHEDSAVLRPEHWNQPCPF